MSDENITEALEYGEEVFYVYFEMGMGASTYSVLKYKNEYFADMTEDDMGITGPYQNITDAIVRNDLNLLDWRMKSISSEELSTNEILSILSINPDGDLTPDFTVKINGIEMSMDDIFEKA